MVAVIRLRNSDWRAIEVNAHSGMGITGHRFGDGRGRRRGFV